MIYLLGASGHAKVIIEILELQGKAIGGLYDQNPEIKFLIGYPVKIYTTEILTKRKHNLLITVGSNTIRKRLALENNCNYVLAIHPNSYISKRALILDGTVVMAGVCINADTRIGFHCIINTNASIDHDCCLEDYVHISPNAVLAGNVLVKEGAHIGIGASVIQGVIIGRWSTIGAGAVIIKDIPDFAVVVGNPGKVIKFNEENT